MNFGCPVRYPDGTGCGCPVLTYHHFDPPWKDQHIHYEGGMIALCSTHHDQADGGLWTANQLREMKQNPFIDDVMKVPWPWQPETLMVKMGTCLLVGTGSPLRLQDRQILGIRQVNIANLDTGTVIIDSDIVDSNQNSWLKIEDGFLNLDITNTVEMSFTAQTKNFVARNRNGTNLKLSWKKILPEQLPLWINGFARRNKIARDNKMTKADFVQYLSERVVMFNCVDSDGFIPYLDMTGYFRTPDVTFRITKKQILSKFGHHLLGKKESVQWHSHVVDEKHSITLTHNRKGQERHICSVG